MRPASQVVTLPTIRLCSKNGYQDDRLLDGTPKCNVGFLGDASSLKIEILFLDAFWE
jgi:hypothetical protein